MFITERQNYNESALFLLAARSTLSEIVNQSSSKSKRDLVEFIQNEASDFEIMSLLMIGQLPPVKYSVIGEKILFSKLKEGVLRNFSKISETVGETTLNTFIHEVDSVYPKFSTQKTVLEFYSSVSEQNPFVGGRSALYGPSAAPSKMADPKATEDWAHSGMGIKGDPKDQERVSILADYAKKIKEMGEPALQKFLAAVSSPAGMAVGGAALAALVTFAAYKLYKNYFSKAAKACAGKKGAEKDACMQAHRMKAKQAQAKVLMRGMSACKNSKDPAKCKAAIQAKIAKLKK